MTNQYPHELSIGDVYYTPLILVVILAFFATVITVTILNKFKLARYFYAPAYVFIAIMTLYILLIDKFLIKF